MVQIFLILTEFLVKKEKLVFNNSVFSFRRYSQGLSLSVHKAPTNILNHSFQWLKGIIVKKKNE